MNVSERTRRLLAVAEEYKQVKAEWDAKKEAFDQVDARLSYLSDTLIPELMEDLGMVPGTHPTEAGRIRLKESVHASIPPDQREKVYEYIDKIGEGGIIKRAVEIQFRRDQEAAAQGLLKELQKQYETVTQKKDIHHSTFSAWVRRRLRDDQPVPPEVDIHTKRSIELLEDD